MEIVVTEARPVSPEALATARRLVAEYPQCFWSWHPDATVETWDDCYLVVKGLRTHGGHRGWAAAQELWKCL